VTPERQGGRYDGDMTLNGRPPTVHSAEELPLSRGYRLR
jgi:hypothetical protein